MKGISLFSVSLFQCLMILSSCQGKVTNESPPLAGKPAGETPAALVIRLPMGSFDPLTQAWPPNVPENLIVEDYPPDVVGYYLLQFKGPVLQEWKDAVINAGGQFFDYIPDFTFIVKMDKKTKVLVESMEPVRWVGIYQPAYRISLDLMRVLTKGGEERQIDMVIIVFREEPLLNLIEKIEANGGSILNVSEGKWKSKLKVRVEPQHLSGIARMTGVKWIERAPEFKLFPTLQKGGDN